jgi:hypothetical protein
MFTSVTKYSRLSLLIINLKIKIPSIHIKLVNQVIMKLKQEIIMDYLLNNRNKANWT